MSDINQISNKRILYSPLNWGMGHVARSIALIDELLSNGNKLFIACDRKQRAVYETYFNDITFIDHQGYPFRFKGKGRFGTDLLMRLGPLQERLNREKKEAEDYVVQHNIDLVISDHRYGFYSEEVPSVFLTHQVHLPLKWYQFAASMLHKKYLKKFSEYWILDYKDSRLAGKLSYGDGSGKEQYIGPYSRFKLYKDRPKKDIDELLIASGPKIYAQQLIDKVLNETADKGNLVIICEDQLVVPDDVRRINGSWKDKDAAILRAKKLISRSGYSTIMDVDELNVPAKYYSTPGQLEQEYLADLHREN